MVSARESIHALLVEDNPGDVALARAWIEDDSFRPVSVESARSLAEAKLLIDNAVFDIILLDLGLPDSSGIETFRKVQGLFSGKPVIVLTGQDDLELASACIDLGAQDFLVKGHVQGFITHAIQNAVGRAALTSALAASYENYRRTIESLRDATLILNGDNRVLYSNLAAIGLFGEGAGEGRRLDFSPPATGCEMEIVGPDGKRIIAEVSAGETDWYGLPARVFILRDTSEKKIAERRIENLDNILQVVRSVDQLLVKEKDERRLIQRACNLITGIKGCAGACVVLADKNSPPSCIAGSGYRRDANSATQKVVEGYSPPCYASLPGTTKKLLDLDVKIDCSECLLNTFPGIDKGLVLTLNCGKVSYGYLVVSIPPEYSENTGIRDLLSEMTDDIGFALRAIRLELKEQENEDFFRTSFEQSPVGKSITSIAGVFMRVNRSFADMLGYEPEELEGRAFADLTHPDDRETSTASLSALLDGGTAVRYEKRFFSKFGKTVWVDVNVAIVRDAAQKPLYFLSTFINNTATKIAEEELRREKDFSESLVEEAQAVIVILDPGGGICFANPYFSALVGYQPGKPLARETFLSYISESGHHDFSDDLARVFGGGAVTSTIFPMIASNGGKFDIEWSFSLLRRSGTETPGVLAIGHDVTLRERSIRETKALLHATRAVVSAEGFSAVSRLVFTECGNLLGTLHGYIVLYADEPENTELFSDSGASVAIGNRLRKVRISTVFPPVSFTGKPLEVRNIPESPLGPYFSDCELSLKCVLFAPIFLDGREAGFVAYANKAGGFTDRDSVVVQAFGELVTISLQNYRQRETLLLQEEQYRTLVENMDDVVFSADSDGRICFISSAIGRYGYSSEELIGLLLPDMVNPSDRYLFDEYFSDTLGGTPGSLEFQLVGKDGTLHFVRMTNRTLSGTNAPIALTGVIEDLTSVRLLEEQLRMSQKMEAIGHLAGGIAHDFNNILSVILSYTKFCLNATQGNAAVQSDLEEILTAGNRATALTRQLLAFSRKQVLAPEILNINSIIGEMEKMLQRLIGEDITLSLRLMPELWLTKVDHSLVDQVLLNLCVNARDAMQDGGTLLIETDNAELDEEYALKHLGVVPGAYIMIAVSDTGCGMDQHILDHLFEPFFTTKVKGKGTGLGLSTVYGIVKQSGGSIWVYSEIGHGTTFKIYLKKYAGTEAASATRAVSPSVKGKSMQGLILVVEDDESIRKLTRRMLESFGFTVLCAPGGAEALEILRGREGNFDLLLTDVVMPNMTGKELSERAAEIDPTLKFLFMSGYTDNIIARHGILDPGVHLLGKPFTPDMLITRICEILDFGAGTVAEMDADESKDAAPERRTPLSGDTLTALQKSCVAAKLDDINALAEQIGKSDAETAETIRRLAGQFDYAGIIKFVGSQGESR